MKTVAVLGASYGGTRAAQILAQELPRDWRVVLIDRNTHFNHLYVLPRCAILPQHAHKAFIPYTGIFRGPSAPEDKNSTDSRRAILLHAQVTALSAHSVTLSRSFPEYGIDGPVLDFHYAVYALGSHLPAPINLWGPYPDAKSSNVYRGCKVEGVSWLRKFHDAIEQASSVLVVGGGALGIQYASDIAEVFPTKSVTLLHSRPQLLPRFDEAMHEEIVSALESLNVKTVLGERLDMSSMVKTSEDKRGRTVRTVKTQSGKEISAGIVLLCTGQTPNTGLVQSFLPDSIVPAGPSQGMVRVKRTMQVAVPSTEPADDTTPRPSRVTRPHEFRESDEDDDSESDEEDDSDLSVPYPHLFAIGDAADAYGAINAGHTAYFQGEIAARNILQLIQAEEASDGTATEPKLQRYRPGAPGIKISLGLSKSLYQVDGVVGKKSDVSDDLDAPLMWKLCGVETDEEGMYL
ncbi:hypothetical protein EIP86_005272 [Pleurotus ostreatoroseus]|nr:hypothetical protein EIP86_005272 [Pleurotus ostreatoroseus]